MTLLDEFMSLRDRVPFSDNQDSVEYFLNKPDAWKSIFFIDHKSDNFLSKYDVIMRDVIDQPDCEEYVLLYLDILDMPLDKFDELNESLGYPPIDRTDQIEAGEYE